MAQGHSGDHDEPAGSPMILTPVGSSLGRRRLTAGFGWEHRRYNTMPARDAHELHHEDRDVHGKNHEERYAMQLGYGVTDRLSVFASLPIVSKTSIQIDNHRHLGRGERAAGLGDLALSAHYQFMEGPIDAAARAGVETPTGETSDHDQAGQKFQPEQQPGGGAWNGEFGLAASRRLGPISVASGASYIRHGEGAQDHRSGDAIRSSVGFGYALPLAKAARAHAVLELQGEWAFRDRSRGERHVLDSGGTTVLVSPGVAVSTEQITLYWAMPVPVYQNLGGEHEELKYELLSGMVWRF